MKNGGKILFVDWSEESILGPKKEKIISKEKTIELFGKRGISFERDIDAGEHHYGMILINSATL